jgi:predicted CXXCH cytochrome family protein
VDSCQRTSLAPGEVGTTTCLACHDGRSASDHQEFLQSPHQSLSCESCHGPGLTHVRQGGRLGLFINNPGRRPFAERHLACTECHADSIAPGDDTAQGFLATSHFAAGAATCTDCHDVHKMGGMTISSPSPTQFGNENYAVLCGQCHEGQVDDFTISKHAEQDVATCSSCHDMHGATMFRATPEDNRLCLQCHQSFALGFETDEDVDFHTGIFHPVDPAGSGSSRCTGCHLPPLVQQAGELPAHDHTLFTIPPIATNEAVERGADPAPPNSCAGVTGCHDSNVPGSGAPRDENNLDSNAALQSLYEFIGARP